MIMPGLIASVALVGCQRREADTAHTLRIGMPTEPPSLNPQLDPLDARGRDIAYYIYESLAQPDAEGTLQPRLAESWSVSADHTSFTFRLRNDVRWHDGQPFTADDVVFTFETLRDPKTPAAGIRSYLEPLASVRKSDPYTVVFTTKTPYWYALDALSAIYIYPKHAYGRDGFNRAPIGTGIYKFVRWDSGERILLHRNEDYYGRSHAHMVEIAFIYVPDAAMRLQMAKNGQLDVIERLTPEQWVQAQHDAAITDAFTLMKHVPDGLQLIVWNEARPQLADAKVRVALSTLIDKHDIVQHLRYGIDLVATGWFYPGSPSHGMSAVCATAACATSAAIAFIPQPLPHGFAFTLMYPASNPFYEQLAATLQSELASAHVTMTSQAVEWAVFNERLRKHDFDAAALVVRLEPRSDPYAQFHTGGGANWGGYSNAKADAIIDDARTDFDDASRARKYRELDQLLAEDQPFTPLFSRYNLSMVSKHFVHVASSPYGLFRYEDFAYR